MRCLVLGGGAQGSAAAFDLLRTDGVEHVVLADKHVSDPPPFLRAHVGGRLALLSLDATRTDEVLEAMRGQHAVLCALPYFFGYEMAELAVSAGAHYCDLGGNTEIVERQRTLDGAAKGRGVSVIPDCGLAPGMVNILAQAGIDQLDEVRWVQAFVGGLPQHPKPPLNYQVVYSLEGVLDYYTTPSIVLENGEIREKEALSDVERVEFPAPVGELEAFHTAGGISTLPYRYRGSIPRMQYKTLRYPGHAEIMRSIRELGLLSLEPARVDGCDVVPRQLFIEVVRPLLENPEGEDLVALRVEVLGLVNRRERTIRYQLIDFYDRENGLTAMMRTTGFSLALTAVMQVDGRIREKGVRTPDECVPPDEYIREMSKRGVEIQRSES
jgi:lysine 6-dehydrogenase